MTSVNDDFPDHAMALLSEATDVFRRDVREAADAADVPEFMRAVRGSQIRVLQLTPRDGMRATDLAHRVGMTKQAVGEFAASLAELGLFESVSDPADKRVRIWRPTALGLEAATWGDRVIATVERSWRRRIGAREWEAMRASLIHMVEIARKDAR